MIQLQPIISSKGWKISSLNSTTRRRLFSRKTQTSLFWKNILSLWNKQNKSDIEDRSTEVLRIAKKLDEQMQDYGMCKRELEKAINLLEISHAKYKHLENYAQLLYDKNKKSNETSQKFIESWKSYIYKWIWLITEANRNQKLVEVGVKLQNKRILKQGFESLKLNLKWEKFIKRFGLFISLAIYFSYLSVIYIFNFL